jgi:hypothetical protein
MLIEVINSLIEKDVKGKAKKTVFSLYIHNTDFVRGVCIKRDKDYFLPISLEVVILEVIRMTEIEKSIANTLYNEGFIGEIDDVITFIRNYVHIYTGYRSMTDLAIQVVDERGIFHDAPRVLVDNFDYYRYSLELVSESTYYQVSCTTWISVTK